MASHPSRFLAFAAVLLLASILLLSACSSAPPRQEIKPIQQPELNNETAPSPEPAAQDATAPSPEPAPTQAITTNATQDAAAPAPAAANASLASLYVSAYPNPATLYLNNVSYGETPLTVENLPPGAYLVKVVGASSGYWPSQVQVKLNPGEAKNISVILRRTTN